MKLIITTLLWLSISFCQTAKQSSGALNPNIGMSAGTYANAGTDKMEVDGFGKFTICIAKTQYSFSTDPNLKGAPSGHVLPIREIRLSSGAEFIVVICGAIMTMPGLPRTPAADSIKLNDKGEIEGLF